MDIANEPIFLWLSQFAYQPEMVYFGIVGLMFASSFGLPLPEEIPLLSGAILAFMASNPDQFPPPFPGATGVEPYLLATICFWAVFTSDLVIYGIGRFFGRSLLNSKRFQKILTPKMLRRVEDWTHKYGTGAIAIFRFTPGIRFPGHMTCGIVGIPIHKFMLVDGIAALLTVPTQILLVAHFGEIIIGKLQQFKLVLLVGFLICLSVFLALRFRRWMIERRGS